MSDIFQTEISIPTDNDGYVLLKCSICGTYFKITPHDLNDDGILELFCPSCGLTSDTYITDDVIDLANAIAKNAAIDYIHNEFKKLEKQLKGGTFSFKAGNPPKHEHENPIRSGIEAMEITTFLCCKRSSKVKPILKFTGCYCPFCGVKNYEVE